MCTSYIVLRSTNEKLSISARLSKQVVSLLRGNIKPLLMHIMCLYVSDVSAQSGSSRGPYIQTVDADRPRGVVVDSAAITAVDPRFKSRPEVDFFFFLGTRCASLLATVRREVTARKNP